jgi:hypothetical protein
MALISWIFVSILSPKHLIGLTGGVFNFMGNLASIVVPIAIGYLAQGRRLPPGPPLHCGPRPGRRRLVHVPGRAD